jgi:signal transduction histidine kinase
MIPSDPINFLLVDDLEENLIALEALLKREGLLLLKARSGADALELLLQHEVGLALVDVQMPEMDGFELAELMRGTERTRRVPIIFLTAGSADRQRRFRGYEAGAVDFLQKPIETDILRSKVEVFFELARQRQEVSRLLEESRRAAEALREADRRKDEFLATLAHELRNPLAPIRTSLQLLKLASHGGPDADVAREIMDRQVAHMVRLIDDLLDISRVNSGKVDLQKRPVSVREVVGSAIEASQPLIDAGRHEFTVRQPDEELHLEADPTRMSQVLSNLLNNAAKYTPEGGRIELVARRENADAVIEVRDNGIGIPTEMLPKVFDLFIQVGKTLDRSQGGLGIGLALVKKLVEMHRGTVDVKSEGLGRGSVFTVRLPIAGDASEVVQLATSTLSTSEAQQVVRILIVDDNADGASSLSRVLSFAGHSVRAANDGIHALAIAREFCPEMVLLDIGLPGMDGYEVAKNLRRMPELSRTVLVAVTGWGSEDDRKKTHDAGIDHHLTKPVEMSQLDVLLAGVKASIHTTK